MNFDLIIASSGYEARASYISSQLNKKGKEKMVFAFLDYEEEIVRILNDEKFKEFGFKNIYCRGNDPYKLIESINDYISSHKGDLTILFDYSSMTRVWYGSVVNYFKNLQIQNRLINIFFSYSSSEFYEPIEKDSKTSNFEPIDGFCSLSVPSIPTALITGLGYERNKAFGLKEFFDAELVYLFHTNSNKFTEFVIEKNKELIQITPPEYIIPYSLNDILLTKTILYDLCINLKNDFRVIIAPCGPKPFTMLSFLIAAELGSIDVWRISSQEIGSNSNRVPNGEIVTIEICYE